MRRPFCILSVRGDVLADGDISFVAATETLRAARQRIEALAKHSPGQYVIYNGQTGECLPVPKRRTRSVPNGRIHQPSTKKAAINW